MEKIFLILAVFSIVLTSNGTLTRGSISTADNDIIWQCLLYSNETNGKSDTAIIGEATDAHDGLPIDSYDTVKPPTPITPYVRMYLDDNLPAPYNLLWKDYRNYPDSYKVWNLSIQWAPTDGISPTDITISWDHFTFERCEYTILSLCTNAGSPLRNMWNENTYTFSCPAYVVQNFKIIGQRENTPPEPPVTPEGETFGYHATTYIYMTSGIDSDGDDMYYQFDWGDDTLSSWLGPYASGQTIQTSYRWDNPGVYLVKTHSKDVLGQMSSWSDFLSVVMQNRAPGQPTNPSPQNEATNIRITENLSWVGSDPDGDALTYDVYFAVTNPPQKIIDNQSTTSFHPGTLSPQTTYYWQIIARDGYGFSTSSQIWSFTTATMGNGSEQPENDTNQTNLEPKADASLSEHSGIMGSFLVFNGSRSYDSDGYLTKWSWDFGDGTTGIGERTTHAYQMTGNFQVTLTVTDDDEATATDTITVQVISANLPPTKPILNGTKTGSKNTPYVFTISSTDAENNFLQYTILWGDGSQNKSLFLPNGTTWSVSHSWAGSGKYHLIGIATDNKTTSEQASLDVFIDVLFISDLGFLYDANNDGTFDSLHVNSTGRNTTILQTSDGSYYLDTNGDGKWDYLYNPSNGSVTTVTSNVTMIENPWFFIVIIAIAVIIIAVIVYLYKKNYF